MSKLGCSTRIIVLVAAVMGVLLIIGLISGSLGTSLAGRELIPFLSQPTPEPKLEPEVIFSIAGWPITNSIIAAWFTIVVLVGVAFVGTRKMSVVPGRFQSAVEFAVQSLLNFVEGFAGSVNGRKFFPVVGTIFFFVMFNAYFGLLPFFGEAIEVNGHTPLFRPANTDLMMPAALALTAVFFIEYWGIRAAGFGPYMKQFFNVGGIFKGFGQLFRGNLKGGFNGIFMGGINLFVGLLELLSHFVRILSFTLRLFGNMTAGEILIVLGSFLVSLVVTDFVYGLELLVGFVQALVFAGLTLAFAMVAVSVHDHEGH